MLTNGLVLPLIAASIRTAALAVMLPSFQKNMADMGQPQTEIDAALGNVAVAFEVAALHALLLLERPAAVACSVVVG